MSRTIGDQTIVGNVDVQGRLMARDLIVKSPTVDYRMFGSDSMDFSTRLSAAVDSVPNGGTIVIPPGTYTASSQPVIDIGSREWRKVHVLAYGVKLLTSGSIYGMRATGGAVTSYMVLEGLTIDHTANTSALGGILVENSLMPQLKNITVVHDNYSGSVADYAAIRLRNSTASNNGTSALLALIEHLHLRKYTGNDMPIGIAIEGASNSPWIKGGWLTACDDCILIQNQETYTYWPNTVLIDGVRFENGTRAVKIAAQNSVKLTPGTGPRIVNCRMEGTGMTLLTIGGFSYTASTISFDAATATISDSAGGFPPSMAAGTNITISGSASNNGRYTISSSNTASAIVVSQTLVTEAAGASVKLVWHPEPFIQISGTTLVGGSILSNPDGVYVALIDPPRYYFPGAVAFGSGMAVDYTLIGELRNNGLPIMDKDRALLNITGLSSTNTKRKNIRGTATISNAASTATVTFTTDEPDANYSVYPVINATSGTPAAGSTNAYVTARATTGFTINLDAAPGAGNSVTVEWILVR